jgi:hypothetical protein
MLGAIGIDQLSGPRLRIRQRGDERYKRSQSVGFSHVSPLPESKTRNGTKPKNPALRVPLRRTKDLARQTMHRFAKSARKRPEAGKKFRTCGRKNSMVLIPATVLVGGYSSETAVVRLCCKNGVAESDRLHRTPAFGAKVHAPQRGGGEFWESGSVRISERRLRSLGSEPWVSRPEYREENGIGTVSKPHCGRRRLRDAVTPFEARAFGAGNSCEHPRKQIGEPHSPAWPGCQNYANEKPIALGAIAVVAFCKVDVASVA